MSRIRFNQNEDIRRAVAQAVDKNHGYCPCRLEKAPDNMCMCKEFRDMVSNDVLGLCHCGLYESYDPNDTNNSGGNN